MADVPGKEADAATRAVDTGREGAGRSAVAPRPQPIHDQTFEFRETSEELRVEKELFVREEVIVSKLIETHTEQIRGSVRRTEVEVERLPPTAPPVSAGAGPAIHAPHSEAAVARAPAPARGSDARSEGVATKVEPPVSPQPMPRPRQAEEPVEEASASSDTPWSWWVRFAILTVLAIIAAFYGGQLLGTIFPSF